MRVRPLVIGLFLAVAALCSPTSSLSQTIFGTILGTVTDPSGAIMPNVVVRVTSQTEGITHEYRTDAQGNSRLKT